MLVIDVDGVIALAPASTDEAEQLTAKGYEWHEFDRLGPDGQPARGWVWLRAEHGAWLREGVGRGVELVWAISWNHVAVDGSRPDWGCPRYR